MPGKQRIGYHKRLELIKPPTTKNLGFRGQSHSLFIGEPKPLSFELLFENTVLFDQIVDDHQLVVVKPTGQGDYKKVEGLWYRGH
ncbi:MAG: hypothetical protein WCH04_18970 [Gammaproteobacteria bacterium]